MSKSASRTRVARVSFLDKDFEDYEDLGGVNQCRLAKFRGLVINAKYSPVIGWENHTFE
jgi:hypothetical protein